MLHDLKETEVTNDQFDAIAKLLRLTKKSRDAALLVLVGGVTKADTARKLKITPGGVSNAITRVNRGMDLARKATGFANGGQNVSIATTKGAILINVQSQDDDFDPIMEKIEGEQAVASALIEGFVPDAAFDQDFADFVARKITREEYTARSRVAAHQLAAKVKANGSAQ